jgi:hypothetical protein
MLFIPAFLRSGADYAAGPRPTPQKSELAQAGPRQQWLSSKLPVSPGETSRGTTTWLVGDFNPPTAAYFGVLSHLLIVISPSGELPPKGDVRRKMIQSMAAPNRECEPRPCRSPNLLSIYAPTL